MGQILLDGTAGRKMRQEQLGQGDAENEDAHLGIRKSRLKDGGGSCGLKQVLVGEWGQKSWER